MAFDQLSAIDHSLMAQDDGFPSQASDSIRSAAFTSVKAGTRFLHVLQIPKFPDCPPAYLCLKHLETVPLGADKKHYSSEVKTEI